MSNNFKNEIEREFDKTKNYNMIMSKVQKNSDANGIRKKMLSSKTQKHRIISTVLLTLTAICVVGLVFFKSPNQTTNIAKKDSHGVNIELNINNMDNMDNMSMANLDLDIQSKDIEMKDLPQKFYFMKNIILPQSYKLENRYAVYTRGTADTDKYDLLHDHIFNYKKNDNEYATITFSDVEPPLRDCFYQVESGNKSSTIDGVHFVISKFTDMYLVTFEHNGIYFDIETVGLSQDELVDLLTSIIE